MSRRTASFVAGAVLAACATPPTGTIESTPSTLAVVSPASGTTESLSPSSTVAPTTTPPSTVPPSTVLPLPSEVPGHHLGPIPQEEQVRCSPDTGSLLVGAPVAVEGFDDRPTLVQAAADPTAPLVVVFHGQNGCIENVQSRSDLDVVAAGAGVSVLWLSGKPLPTRSWNTNGSCCEPASSHGVDDLAYVDAAVEAALVTGLTPRRILSAGVSNGGGMAISVACRRPGIFAGAVSVAGWAPVECEAAALSLLVFGGSADESLGAVRATQVASMWRSSVVECPGEGVVDAVGIRTATTWSGCSGATTVRLVTLQGVPHVWPKFVDYDMDDDIILFALGHFGSATP